MIFQIGQSDGRNFWLTHDIPSFENEDLKDGLQGIFHKTGKTFGQKLMRQYFLIKQYLFYSNIGDNKNIKGYVRLDSVYTHFETTNCEFQIYLKNNGFQIILSTQVDELFNQWTDALSERCILTTFDKDYVLGSLIGNGNFSTVYQCWNKKGEQFAVKAIQKQQSKQVQMNREYQDQLLGEISSLRNLNHSNIIKLFRVYENKEKLFLVTELIIGHELISKNSSKAQYSAIELRAFIYQMLQAIQEIQNQNYMHRDIKPQNIMLRNGNLSSPCLIDFGLAASTQSKNIPFPSCGSPGYAAPELIKYDETKRLYNGQCDIFSFGVTLFSILFGYNPYKGPDKRMTVKRNADAYFEIPSGKYPTQLENLIIQMTKKHPKDRITAEQALNHIFFQEKIQFPFSLPKSIITKQQYELNKTDNCFNVHASLDMDFHFGINPLIQCQSPNNQINRTSTINSNPQKSFSPLGLDEVDEFQLNVIDDKIESSHIEKLKLNQRHFAKIKSQFHSLP